MDQLIYPAILFHCCSFPLLLHSPPSLSISTLFPCNQHALNQPQLAQTLATPQIQPERNHMTKAPPSKVFKRLRPLPLPFPPSSPYFPTSISHPDPLYSSVLCHPPHHPPLLPPSPLFSPWSHLCPLCAITLAVANVT